MPIQKPESGSSNSSRRRNKPNEYAAVPGTVTRIEIIDKGERKMQDRIKEAIEEIRPYLQSHGGDVEFISFVEGVVNVKLQGACHGCAGAQATLKNGIQRILQEQFPEDVKSVESV